MGSQGETRVPEIAVTSIRIEKDKLDAFKSVAKQQRRSVAQHLRFLIDQAIAETEEAA